MTVRLTVQRAAWRSHVEQVAAAYGDTLVPVVKGNGYGFGRTVLHQVVRDLAIAGSINPTVCVGSVHELADVPAALTPVVLTPTLAAPIDRRAVLTVGSIRHVQALEGWRGRVVVKLASSMQRYGTIPDDLPALLAAVDRAGLTVEAFGLHLPLAGDESSRQREVDAWLAVVPTLIPVWVSHLAAATVHELQQLHPDRRLRVRLGTALWHGSPRGDHLQLSADVLQTRAVTAGDLAGYRHTVIPHDGTLVAVGAGTANGVAPLDHPDPDRRSPFHFARRRIPLLEAPHMHTSLLLVPTAIPCPTVGDRVDLQRPLTSTLVDEIDWR